MSQTQHPFAAFAPDFYSAVAAFPDFRLGAGLSEAEIEDLEKDSGFPLAPQLRRFLSLASRLSMNGLSIDSSSFATINLPESEALLLGEFYLRNAGDRLLMRPNDDGIYYLEHNNGMITKIAKDLDEFFNSFLPRCL